MTDYEDFDSYGKYINYCIQNNISLKPEDRQKAVVYYWSEQNTLNSFTNIKSKESKNLTGIPTTNLIDTKITQNKIK
jgi:hypothetical protein